MMGGQSKAEPPVRPPGCGRAPICTALQYKYPALCHCSCIKPLPGNTGRPVRKCLNLLCPAGREESCCLFSNKQKIEQSQSILVYIYFHLSLKYLISPQKSTLFSDSWHSCGSLKLYKTFPLIKVIVMPGSGDPRTLPQLHCNGPLLLGATVHQVFFLHSTCVYKPFCI